MIKNALNFSDYNIYNVLFITQNLLQVLSCISIAEDVKQIQVKPFDNLHLITIISVLKKC